MVKSDITADIKDQVMNDLVLKIGWCKRALGECALVPDPSPISHKLDYLL